MSSDEYLSATLKIIGLENTIEEKEKEIAELLLLLRDNVLGLDKRVQRLEDRVGDILNELHPPKLTKEAQLRSLNKPQVTKITIEQQLKDVLANGYRVTTTKENLND